MTAEDKEKGKILQSIPAAASVSAVNNLGVHLANRRYLWRFPIGIEKADYIVVDPSLPGRNFDLAQISKRGFDDLWSQLLTDRRFSLYYRGEGLTVLQKRE